MSAVGGRLRRLARLVRGPGPVTLAPPPGPGDALLVALGGVRSSVNLAKFAQDTALLGMSPEDAARVSAAAVEVAALFDCSQAMLLDYAFVHLAAGDSVEQVDEKVRDYGSVSYAAVSRWSQ